MNNPGRKWGQQETISHKPFFTGSIHAPGMDSLRQENCCLSTRKLSVRPLKSNSSLSEDTKAVFPKRLPYVVIGARAQGQ